MPLPAGVEKVTVSSGVPLTLPDGRWIEGKLIITGPDLVTVSEDDFTFGGGVSVPLVDGEFSVRLVATDASGMSPHDWTYTVTSKFTNAPNWVRYISLPKANASVKLDDVLVPDPVAGEYSVLVNGDTLLAKAANLSDLLNTAEARDNLELGEAATLDVGTEAGTVAAGDDPRFAQSKPWVFDVTTYGAVGDAVLVYDGQVTINVPTLTCSTSARFHAGLVGKSVLVQGAGTFGVTAFKTTFAAYNSPTSMALAAAPPTSITNAVVVFGTNNYTAVRAATAAAEAYLAAAHTTAEVYSPPGAYILDGPLDTSKSGNGQVPISVYPTTGVKKIPHFRGAVSGAGVRHWEQKVPQYGGSCWISFGFYASSGAQLADINANGNPGIISAPNEGTSNGLAYGAAARFSNVMPMITDMAFLLPHTAFGISYGALNLFGAANAHVENVSISTLGVVPGTDYQSPGVFGTGLSIAALMPAPGNNDLTLIRNLSIQGGFTYGIFFSEHTVIDRIMVLYCWAGLCPVGTYAGSVGAAHPMKVSTASIEQCTRQVYFIGVGSQGVGPRVDIDQLQTESGTPTFDGNSTAALAGAEGRITLTGLFTRSGVTVVQPSGIELIDGQAPRAIVRRTANYTASPLDRTVLMDTTSGPLTLTLPNADYNAVEYVAKNTGTGTLTVATTAGQLIYPTGTATGSTTTTVSAGNFARFQAVYNGTAWAWYQV
ncbi:hypothetical protein [Streptomyces sp. NPDC005760]|uniref:hypothetical protein n=1 Tax=Streptomyces sp. NPDC005760 TaxID=3156718 RepID=UPI0033FBD58E